MDRATLRCMGALILARQQVRRPASKRSIGMMKRVNLTIELERENDGRWIAEAVELPGVLSYGTTREEAISNTERLAIEVIADRIAHHELPASALGVHFTIPDEQLASN